MDMHVMRQSNAAMKAKETEEVAVCVCLRCQVQLLMREMEQSREHK
jgi:hypothetical protein